MRCGLSRGLAIWVGRFVVTVESTTADRSAAGRGRVAAGGWRGRLASAGRLVVLVAGLFCFASGIVLTLHSGLGLGPWDVFHQGLARTGPTLAEHLKVHAVARLLLAGSINNLQVSWVKLNRRLSQLCLHAGANDYGGTLMEENISREAGATAGQYTSPEDFQSLILEIGRIPAERNTTYKRMKIKLPAESAVFESSLVPEFA